MSDLPRSRATAVKALIDQWQALAIFAAKYQHCRFKAGTFRAKNEGHFGDFLTCPQSKCALVRGELAALLLREGPQEGYTLEGLAHHLGLGTVTAQTAYDWFYKRETLLRLALTELETHKSDAATTELAIRDRIATLKSGLMEGQEPPAKPPDFNPNYSQCSECGGTFVHYAPCRYATAGLREGPPAPPGHAAAAPYTEPEQALDPGIRCAVRMLRKAGFETTDSGDGVSKPADERTFEVPHVIALAAATTMCAEAERMASILGAGWMVQASYATDDKTCVLLATFLAASQTGAAPQEAIPDHCENCRAEMPLTTVHLCHACLPSAPREHAGEAPATESDHEAPLEVVRQVIASLRDVVSVGRFAVAVDPARFCNDLASHLESAVAKLAASQAGTAPREAKGDYSNQDIYTLIQSVTSAAEREDWGVSRDRGLLLNIIRVIEGLRLAAHGAVPPQEQK